MDNETNSRFDAIETRLGDIESRMATKDDIASIESRMATQDDIAELKGHIADVYVRIEEFRGSLERRMDDSERKMGILVEDLHHKLDLIIEGFGGQNDRMAGYEIYNDSEHKALDRRCIENAAATVRLDGRVTRLEKSA